MSRIWRQALVALMLVLYGSVSLCGSGLHHLTEPSGSHVTPHDHESKSVRAESHCSLCDFHTQGQLTTEPVRHVSRPFTSPHVHLILAVVATRDRHPSCSPRRSSDPRGGLPRDGLNRTRRRRPVQGLTVHPPAYCRVLACRAIAGLSARLPPGAVHSGPAEGVPSARLTRHRPINRTLYGPGRGADHVGQQRGLSTRYHQRF